MDGWRDPIGPLPARTYWLRRLAVVAAVVIVLAVLVAAIGALLPRHQGFGPASNPTPGPISPSGTGAPTPPTTTTPPAPGTHSCDPAKVSVTLTGASAVRSGDKETLTMAVTNNTGADCVLDVNPATATLTISSGSDRIWSTQDCDQWLGQSAKQVVASGKGVEWNVEWPTRRSAASCQLTGDYLKPGTYVARASFGSATHSLVITLRG